MNSANVRAHLFELGSCRRGGDGAQALAGSPTS